MPYDIDNDVFRDHLGELLQGHERLWQLQAAQTDVLLQLVADDLEIIDDAFAGWEDDRRLGGAFSIARRPALVANAATRMLDVVRHWYWGLRGQWSPSGEFRRPVGEYVLEPEEIEEFRDGDSLARQAVVTIRHQAISRMADLVTRLNEDWDDISQFFFDDGLVGLREISIHGAETHKAGRQTCVLTFDMSGSVSIANVVRTMTLQLTRHLRDLGWTSNTINFFPTGRLVYKPFDVEMDCRVAGDVVALREKLPAAAEALAVDQSLWELLNERCGFNLPTYRILPRRFASALHDGELHTCYGYIEFLHSDPSHRRLTETRRDPFFRCYGQSVAVATVFGLTDCHHENVIIHEGLPHLIDLEFAFARKSSSLEDTCLGDMWAPSGGAERPDACTALTPDGEAHVPQARDLATTTEALTAALAALSDAREAIVTWLEERRARLEGTTSRFFVKPSVVYDRRLAHQFYSPVRCRLSNDALAIVEAAGEAIVTLWEDSRAMGVDLDGLLVDGAENAEETEELRTVLEGLMEQYDRVLGALEQHEIPLPCERVDFTVGVAAERVRLFGEPHSEMSPLGVIAALASMRQQDWLEYARKLADPEVQTQKGPRAIQPGFASCTPHHEGACYRRCDVPVFYRRLGDTRLLDARGNEVTDPSFEGSGYLERDGSMGPLENEAHAGRALDIMIEHIQSLPDHHEEWAQGIAEEIGGKFDPG